MKYAIFEVISRFDRFHGYARGVPAAVGFCVHCEKIYDENIYRRLLDFSGFFKGLTGKRLIVCVPTPLSPETRRAMKEASFGESDYAGRLKALEGTCEIGYHGHFYSGEEGGLAPINRGNFSSDVVRRQMADEFAWFQAEGFRPRKYIAGWWFLNEEIVRRLESHGIEADFSMRGSGADTFGGRYLDDSVKPPVGKPFILPPSKGIVEIQTVFGPTTHPHRVGKLLTPYMTKNREEKICFVFAIHDWDLLKFYREVREGVEFISADAKDFAWSDFDSGELDAIRRQAKGAPAGRRDIYNTKEWTKKFMYTSPYDPFDEERVRKIIAAVPPDVKTILDVGAGGGYICRSLRDRKGIGCFGMDISLEMLKRSEEAKACVGDVKEIPFKDGEFDLVLAADLIEHVNDGCLETGISEMARVSAKYILINSPYEDAVYWPVSLCDRCGMEFNIYGHLRRVDRALIERAFPKERFDVLKIEVFGKKRDWRPRFLAAAARKWARMYSREAAVCPNCFNSSIINPARSLAERLFGYLICAMLFFMDNLTPGFLKKGSEMYALLRKKGVRR